jgi:hypothetical protein
MRILDACLYWALGPGKYFLTMGVHSTCSHRPTSIFILTLQACLVCSQTGCRDIEHTTALSMRERGLNETSEWGLYYASPFRTMV